MAGHHPEEERGYAPSRSSLVLAITPRAYHKPSMSELVVGHTPYLPTGDRRRGEQETEPLHRGEVYVVVWGSAIRERSYQGAEE